MDMYPVKKTPPPEKKPSRAGSLLQEQEQEQEQKIAAFGSSYSDRANHEVECQLACS
jgi:hypothetical protein